jgi:hypothetical protein
MEQRQDQPTPDHPFVLFAEAAYYPNGGWGDFRGAYASLADAYAAVQAHQQAHAQTDRQAAYDWYEIVDVHLLAIVQWGGQKYGEFGPRTPDATCVSL